MTTKTEGVAIEKLVLDVGGKKVELSIEQAKRLHGALAEMFAPKVVEHHHHDYYRWPWRWMHDKTSYKAENGLRATFDTKSATLCCKV